MVENVSGRRAVVMLVRGGRRRQGTTAELGLGVGAGQVAQRWGVELVTGGVWTHARQREGCHGCPVG